MDEPSLDYKASSSLPAPIDGDYFIDDFETSNRMREEAYHSRQKQGLVTQDGKLFDDNNFENENSSKEDVSEPVVVVLPEDADVTTDVGSGKKKGRKGKPSKCVDMQLIEQGLEEPASQQVKVTEPSKSFICTECGKAFTTKYTLKYHQTLHSGEGGHKCDQCHKVFTQRGGLRTHLRTTHGVDLSNMKDIIQEKKKSLDPFICKECGKQFTTMYTLKYHQTLHTGEGGHECEYCGKRFTQRGGLNTHRLIHTGEMPFSCDICDRKFRNTGQLKLHRDTHSGERNHVCPVCNKTFVRASHLHQHSVTHTDQRRFKCTVCNKAFRMQCHLKVHMFTHTGEKPYKCTYCEASFAQSCNLKSHMVVHTQESRFNCKVCGHVFPSATSLKTHERIHTKEKPFVCDICGTGFTQMANLKKHQKVHVKKVKNSEQHTNNGEHDDDNSVHSSHQDTGHPSVVNSETLEKDSESTIKPKTEQDEDNAMNLSNHDTFKLPVVTMDSQPMTSVINMSHKLQVSPPPHQWPHSGPVLTVTPELPKQYHEDHMFNITPRPYHESHAFNSAPEAIKQHHSADPLANLAPELIKHHDSAMFNIIPEPIKQLHGGSLFDTAPDLGKQQHNCSLLNITPDLARQQPIPIRPNDYAAAEKTMAYMYPHHMPPYHHGNVS